MPVQPEKKIEFEISPEDKARFDKKLANDLRRAIAEDIRRNFAANENKLNEDTAGEIGGESFGGDTGDIEREVYQARRENRKPNFENKKPANDNKTPERETVRPDEEPAMKKPTGAEEKPTGAEEEAEPKETPDKEASENPFGAPTTEEGIARADIGEIGEQGPIKPEEKAAEPQEGAQTQPAPQYQSQIGRIDNAVRKLENERKALNAGIRPLQTALIPLQIAKYTMIAQILILRIIKYFLYILGLLLTLIFIGVFFTTAGASLNFPIFALKKTKKITNNKIENLKKRIKSSKQRINAINREIRKDQDIKMRLIAQANG